MTEPTAFQLRRLASPRRPQTPGPGPRPAAALPLRLGCAALLAWIENIHLHLWQEGNRQIPTDGPLFLPDAVAGSSSPPFCRRGNGHSPDCLPPATPPRRPLP